MDIFQIRRSADAQFKKEKPEEPKKEKDNGYLENMKESLRIIFIWGRPVLIMAGMILVIHIAGMIITGPGMEEIKTQNATITGLKNSFDIKTNQFKDTKAQDATISDYFYYTGDTSEDDRIAEEYFSHLCTWDDGATYESLRKEMEKAGYQDNSSVMMALFPEQRKYYDQEKEKVCYSIDDNGENMKFESVTTYPISADGSKKEYAGILTVSTKDRTEGGYNREYFGYVYVQYAVENKQIVEVRAESLIEQ